MTNYLFSDYRFTDLTNSVVNEIRTKINGLKKSDFETKSIEQVTNEIYERNSLVAIKLDVDKVYQKDPKDVEINLPSRFSPAGYRTVQGTKFQIIVPFAGDKELFKARPNRYSHNVPYGDINSSELHFVYQIGLNAEKQEVLQAYEANLANIKSWLENLEGDISVFNNQLKNDVLSAVTARKAKLDDDSKAANSFGIPIK